jgi:hypothetical protein
MTENFDILSLAEGWAIPVRDLDVFAPYRQYPALGHRLVGIEDQVLHDLGDLSLVDIHRAQILGKAVGGFGVGPAQRKFRCIAH